MAISQLYFLRFSADCLGIGRRSKIKAQDRHSIALSAIIVSVPTCLFFACHDAIAGEARYTQEPFNGIFYAKRRYAKEASSLAPLVQSSHNPALRREVRSAAETRTVGNVSS